MHADDQKNYYKHTVGHPYHLSVGAVLFNDNGRIAVHHFNAVTDPDPSAQKTYHNIKTLMRETPELGETLEETLHRGILEEFGGTGDIVDFLGSIVGPFWAHGVEIEKTTLYFAVALKNIDENKRESDDEIEASAQIKWHTPEKLIAHMREQKKQAPERGDADESKVVQRAMPIITQYES